MRVGIREALKWGDVERRREGGIDADRVRASLCKDGRSERRCCVKVNRGSNGSNEPGQPISIIFLRMLGLFEWEKCGYEQYFRFSTFINESRVFGMWYLCWKTSIQEGVIGAGEVEDKKEGQCI